MRQRYYNTEIKRFINQDIVVGSISNSQSLNRYSYVQGNPVTLTDPFGLSPSAKDIIMGAIHGILDVVGCSPELIGMGANLINAALYAFVDHDYGMAALSLLAGVTFGAAKVVAMGGKFAKAAKTVETAGRFVSNVANFAVCATQAVNVGSEMWQKYYVEGKSLDGSSAMEFLTLGLNMAGMAMSGKGMVESGNKICKSIKESGVTRKISGKVKSGVKTFWYDNRGFVDFSAPIGGYSGSSSIKTDFYVTKDKTVISANKVKSYSQYDRLEIEIKSGKSVRPQNAVDDWDEFLGSNQTNINPFTGEKSVDRIWSEDGKRSIRFGEHEMNSMGTRNFHYHKETWYDDYVINELQRIQKK